MIDSWNLLFLFAQVNFGYSSASTFQSLAIATWIANAVVHITFALAVFSDSHRRTTFLVQGWVWTLAILLGGVFVVGIYWLIHHSNFRSSSGER